MDRALQRYLNGITAVLCLLLGFLFAFPVVGTQSPDSGPLLAFALVLGGFFYLLVFGYQAGYADPSH